MKTRNKVFTYSALVLSILGAGSYAYASSNVPKPYGIHYNKKAKITNKQANQELHDFKKIGRRSADYISLQNVLSAGGGKATERTLTDGHYGRGHYSRSMMQGSINEGSPYHYPYNTPDVITNGASYDRALGYFHSHVEYKNLVKPAGYHRVIRIVNPKEGHTIQLYYPKSAYTYIKTGKGKSAKIKKQPVDTLLRVTPARRYLNWKGNRSIVFSKDLYDGFTNNGFDKLSVSFTFYNPSNHKPIKLNNSWMLFRQINGLSPYARSTSTVRGGDAFRNADPFSRADRYDMRSADDMSYSATQEKNAEFVDANKAGEREYTYKNHNNGIWRHYSPTLGQDVIGGRYDSPYNDYSDLYSHSLIFHLNGDSARFMLGSLTGYDSVQPQTNVSLNMPSKKPTLYYCHIDKSGQPVTNLTVGTKASRYQLSDGHKFKISKAQYHNIVNGDHKITKHGLKYWEDNIMPCPVTTPHKDTPAHPKINPFHPTTPVKYVTGVHTMNTINADGMTFHNQGGALSHPNQTYTYHIDGKLPERTIDNTPYYKYYNHYDKNGNLTSSTPYIDHYYDGHLDDYWDVTDKLPKYVSIKKANVDINGATATHDKHHVYVNFDHDTWDANNGGTYHITIKVQANHLPHLSKNEASHKHWIQMLNGGNYDDGGGFNTDTYADGQNDGNYVSPKYSNPVPTEIKLIKANIWHYDYNYDRHVTHNWFPDSEQPMGITNDVYDPLDDDFKNYRYHGNFNQNSGDVLKHQSDSWYAGSYHNVNTLTNVKNKDGHYYRVAYPTLQDDGYYDAGFPIGESHSARHNQIQEYKPNEFKAYENYLFNGDKNQINPPDMSTYSDGYDYNGAAVLMNTNPDGTDANGDDNNAFTDSGYTQNDYIPYYVPRVSLNQHINPRTGKAEPSKSAYRMVIDTDKTDHGLPFRLDMKAQNLLYGTSYKDFKGVYVKMDITANNGKDELYSNTRPLAGNSQDALIHQGTYHKHTHTLSESPKGTNDYHGYIEADALKQAESNNYDLNTAPYNYAKGTRLPIKVSFSLVKANGKPLSKSKQPEVDMTNINTHAYIARDPKVTNNDFGLQQITGDDAPKNPNTINKKQASFVDPERTVEYGDGHVRELKEQLTVTQPRKAIGKAGYGISANDLGVDYRGHLETPRYAHKGTNMQVGFPISFNSKDSNLSYSHDKRNSSLLGTNLLHVSPSISENINNGASDDNDSSTTLDTDDDNDSEDEVDDDFDDAFPEGLHPGEFSTTYGFYPKASVHNQGDNNNDNGNIQLSSDNAGGIFAPHAKYGDALANDSSINKFGLNTNSYNTSNNTKAITADGQNERLYTPIFLNTGKYKMTYHRAFGSTSRKHRLGGNFYDINEKRPIKMTGDMYLTKDANNLEQKNDELSIQPVLTNPDSGLMQTPLSNPAYPDLNDYHTSETVNGHTSNMPTGWLTDNLWTGMFGSSNDYNNID